MTEFYCIYGDGFALSIHLWIQKTPLLSKHFTEVRHSKIELRLLSSERFVVADETEKNIGTVRHGDFYEGCKISIKGVNSGIRQRQTGFVEGTQKVFRKAVQ
jgi:hypothetical protein